jgi:hypothetical protein
MYFTTSFLELRQLTLCAVAIVDQRDTDGMIVEDDESNGSNATPPSVRPSHARKARDDRNGL